MTAISESNIENESQAFTSGRCGAGGGNVKFSNLSWGCHNIGVQWLKVHRGRESETENHTVQ